MSKESIKAVKEATKNLKEIVETKKNANISLFQLSTIETDSKKINTTIVRCIDDTDDFINALSAVLNDDPGLAHLIGHAVANLTGDSEDAFQEGMVYENVQFEMEQITNIALQRVSKQMTNEEYFKELDKKKKEYKKMGMTKNQIKEHIKIFDDGVTDAMKAIKESFTEN